MRVTSKWIDTVKKAAYVHTEKKLGGYDSKSPEEQKSCMTDFYKKSGLSMVTKTLPKTKQEARELLENVLKIKLERMSTNRSNDYTSWLINTANKYPRQKRNQETPREGGSIGGYFPFLEECYKNVQNAIEDSKHNDTFPLKVRFSDQSRGAGDEVYHQPTCLIGNDSGDIDLKGIFVLPRKEMGADGSGTICREVYEMLNRMPDFGIERDLYRITKREKSIEINKR